MSVTNRVYPRFSAPNEETAGQLSGHVGGLQCGVPSRELRATPAGKELGLRGSGPHPPSPQQLALPPLRLSSLWSHTHKRSPSTSRQRLHRCHKSPLGCCKQHEKVKKNQNLFPLSFRSPLSTCGPSNGGGDTSEFQHLGTPGTLTWVSSLQAPHILNLLRLH